MGLIKKDDLEKLKESKPVPITAHSGELVVPVVYASTVQKFLEKKGVKLPLTHKQLAEMKREAASIGAKIKSEKPNKDKKMSHHYLSDTKGEAMKALKDNQKGPKKAKQLKKAKQPKGISVKKEKPVSQEQTVIVNIHKNKRAAPAQRPSAVSHLASIASRANNFAAISPYNLGPQMIGAPLDDKAKLAVILKHFEEQIKKPEPQSHTSAKIHDDEKKIENQFKPIVEATRPIRPVEKPSIVPGEYEHYKKTDTHLTDTVVTRKPDIIAEWKETGGVKNYKEELEKNKREIEKRIKPIVPVAQPLREAHIDRIDVPESKEELKKRFATGWQKYEHERKQKEKAAQPIPPIPAASAIDPQYLKPPKKRTLRPIADDNIQKPIAYNNIQKDLEAKGYVDASRP